MLPGIQPTGRIHLGDCGGTVLPPLEQTRGRKTRFFIADCQAPAILLRAWEAVGIDRDRASNYLLATDNR
jgi:tryptophanyl-tRNA synthetase